MRLSSCNETSRTTWFIGMFTCTHLILPLHKPCHDQTSISWCLWPFSIFLSVKLYAFCLFPLHLHPSISSFTLSPLLCPPSSSLYLPSTELLRHHRPKASQTSRQATDALHAVQPEGKQEGKTPIHGVCFYCLSSHPLKSCRGFRVGNSQAMTPSPPPQPPSGRFPLSCWLNVASFVCQS